MTNTPSKEEVAWLDSREFFEIMQAYRWVPITQPATTAQAFEAVKAFIRDKQKKETRAAESRLTSLREGLRRIARMSQGATNWQTVRAIAPEAESLLAEKKES